MGGVPSSVTELKEDKDTHPGRSDEEIINLVMPLYHTNEPLTSEELAAAVKAWKMIMNDKSQHFKDIKKKFKDMGEEYEHSNCMELFYHTFYTRLFDVHPISKTLFHRSINKQGTFFVRFISMAIDLMKDEEKWFKNFKNLTDIHNKMGVKAVEYGMVGEVLLFAIKTCVGPDVYTETVHNGWAKIYSKMLNTIVPMAVAFELDHKQQCEEAAMKRFKDVSKGAASVSAQTLMSKSGITLEKDDMFKTRQNNTSVSAAGSTSASAAATATAVPKAVAADNQHHEPKSISAQFAETAADIHGGGVTMADVKKAKDLGEKEKVAEGNDCGTSDGSH